MPSGGPSAGRVAPPNLSRAAFYPASMSRRADPERLYIAHRMALSARLVNDARVLPESAERWVAGWEAEARLRGLDAGPRVVGTGVGVDRGAAN